MSIILFAYQNNDVYAEENKELEIKVKAAYLYNFLRFVEWPENNQSTSDICIYGIKESYRTAFSTMATLSKKSKKISIAMFDSNDDVKKLSLCQIIFITDNAKNKSKAVLNHLKDNQSLTVGESDGFIRKGGMINFIHVKDKVRFEINHDVAKAAGLKISSKVLRIAERIVKSEDT